MSEWVQCLFVWSTPSGVSDKVGGVGGGQVGPECVEVWGPYLSDGYISVLVGY